MEYIKNNYKLLIIILGFLVALVGTILQNRQEIEEIKSSYEEKIDKYVTGRSSDSTAYVMLKTSYDSLSNTIKVYKDVDVDTKITKKGEYTYVVVTETVKPDGTITKETKTIKIDTTSMFSTRIKEVIDSMQTIINNTKVEEKIIYVNKTDTVYQEKLVVQIKKDTVYVHKTNPIKKLELGGSIGLVADAGLNVNPIIQGTASYDFIPPFFVSGGIMYEGNPLNYTNPENYKLSSSVGIKFKM